MGAIINPVPFFGCRLFNDGAQSCGTGAVVAILFGGEEYKSEAGLHSTSSNTSRIVATRAGKWRFAYSLSWQFHATGLRNAMLMKNGGPGAVVGSNTMGPGNGVFETTLVGNTTLALVAGDYVEISTFQNAGVALNVGNTVASVPQRVSVFEAQWLGA